MTETTTLTVFQQMTNRLGTGDPNKAILTLLNRIEQIEKRFLELETVPLIPIPPTPVERAQEMDGDNGEEPKKRGRPKGSKNKA